MRARARDAARATPLSRERWGPPGPPPPAARTALSRVRGLCPPRCSPRPAPPARRAGNAGDVLFRPSKKGPDHLTMSWVWVPGTIVHIDILERDKPSPEQLGQKLLINYREGQAEGDSYEALDEIHASYAVPISDLVQQAMEHRKFARLKQSEVDSLVRKEKEQGVAIPYRFSVAEKFINTLVLTFMPKRVVIHELISVRPGGYRMRGIEHHSLEDLSCWFKQNFIVRASRALPRAPATLPRASRSRVRPLWRARLPSVNHLPNASDSPLRPLSVRANPECADPAAAAAAAASTASGAAGHAGMAESAHGRLGPERSCQCACKRASCIEFPGRLDGLSLSRELWAHIQHVQTSFTGRVGA